MVNQDSYIPFSQRTGYTATPTQLKLGEVSSELRRLLYYYIHLEIDRVKQSGYSHDFFSGSWDRVAQDLHVLFFGQNVSTYKNSSYELGRLLEKFIQTASIERLFDMIEFLVRHSGCSVELIENLTDAFVSARAAYRIIDSQIVAIGTEQQGAAFEAAIAAAEAKGAVASRKHLTAAGAELRGGNWAGSVRESIHAVEAMVLKLASDTTTLGPALTKLEKKGHLHGGLKAAFKALYGYSSDEEGVRHALVFNSEAQVDEADALFMLGACASFVSYLIARDCES